MEACLEVMLKLSFCTKPPNFRIETHIAFSGVALRRARPLPAPGSAPLVPPPRHLVSSDPPTQLEEILKSQQQLF
jgi:hypothetical protein